MHLIENKKALCALEIMTKLSKYLKLNYLRTVNIACITIYPQIILVAVTYTRMNCLRNQNSRI